MAPLDKGVKDVYQKTVCPNCGTPMTTMPGTSPNGPKCYCANCQGTKVPQNTNQLQYARPTQKGPKKGPRGIIQPNQPLSSTAARLEDVMDDEIKREHDEKNPNSKNKLQEYPVLEDYKSHEFKQMTPNPDPSIEQTGGNVKFISDPDHEIADKNTHGYDMGDIEETWSHLAGDE